MSNQTRSTNTREVILTRAVAALLGLGALAPIAQAASDAVSTSNEPPLMLAGTVGSERRQDNREDRRDDRGGRQDNRQEARDEHGMVGKDKRDAKQEGRQEARDEANKD
jgi:hypothetical protein